ncbi:acyl-CoA dehydrogenase NM domain-like protein [Morchella conica CCBAS932]|uniref:Acyl-CoA dehydrogenase NM domain-like protein n=1 Tax=Morchella conica CCBAS932 TaxID=1392247 RepID=A0A3N4KN57_9PEZI|nr:acyl-CoA dehydrogenase NM domain-like protein [Morchella conica CCBAS932]
MPTNLETARSSSGLDTWQIGSLLYDDGHREARARIAAILEKEPLCIKSKRPFLNTSQLLHLSLKISKRLLVLRDIHSWTPQEFLIACLLQDEGLVISLHNAAFTPVILAQGSDEQQAQWIPRCQSLEVVGCYAQTELSHGNNVQGLQTTAQYDPATKEFVIDSPGVESTKWWMGGLGILANHAAVIAQLELPDPESLGGYKSYGTHLFIVPIRSPTTHKPLPGITVGLIGPKAFGGFGMTDNGYIRFDAVRIPLENMLNRYSKVTPAGEYIPAKHSKLSYGSMVALRAQIPLSVSWLQARAVTIAIRYCVHRRQFSDGTTEQERQVISYASVQHRLYPLLAQAYANIIASRELFELYYEMNEAIVNRGDVSMLAEMHSLSTAIKCKVSSESSRGIEEARLCLGGHGFSYMSGIGPLFANAVPSQTYEGMPNPKSSIRVIADDSNIR